MPPAPDAVGEQLGKVVKQWERYDSNTKLVLKSRGMIVALREIVKMANQSSPQLLAVTDVV